MKLKLPIIGEVRTGNDIVQPKQKLATTLLGDFMDFQVNKLSSETTISTKLLQANKGWVYRNNDAIAQEVSKMEFELFTVGLSKGEIVYNEVTSHPLLDLLDKPNEEMTKSDAIYIIQSHKKLTGDAFWLKIRNGRQVVGLRNLPPDKIELDLQEPTETDPTIIRAYIYKDTINGQAVKFEYDPNDIIHFKKPNPNNSFRGYGAVEALAETIDLDNLTTETTKRFFQNGAITNFVLSTESKLTEEQLMRLKAELRANNSGASNAYKAMILGGGLKPENISYTNVQMQFLEQLEWYRDKIMVGFGNTKASLGIVEDVNRANAEATLNGWLSSTVKPDMQSIVNSINEFLVPEFGKNLVLGFKDPVPEDRADDIDEATNLFKSGVATRNEVRELLNYEPVDNGDVFLVPSMSVEEPVNADPNKVAEDAANED